MAEDVKDDYILEEAMPSNMTIIKEELSILEDDKLFKPNVENSALKKGYNKSIKTDVTIGLTNQFPKPIVVPKIEVDLALNTRPKIVDMLDLDTESESEDSTSEETDSTVSKNCKTSAKKCDYKGYSHLNSEEIDLGTAIVTKDGDVKIYGLADNLGLHLPKTGFTIEEKLNVLYDSKTSNVSNVKPKNVARKKTTTTLVSKESTIVFEQRYMNETNEKPKPSKTISKIVFENKTSNIIADTTVKNVSDPFFGNKIILGNRSKSKIRKPTKPELKVVAEDCYTEYVNNPNYCAECNVLFTTYKSFDIHYIEKHLNKIQDNEPKSKALDKDDEESPIKDLNDKKLKFKPKNAIKVAKKDGGKDTKGTTNKRVKFKCKICSTIISSSGNMKRHINNIHNAQFDVDLYEKIKISEDLESSSVKTSSNNTKMQVNSLVTTIRAVDKKTSSIVAANIPSNSHDSSESDSDDGNFFENNDVSKKPIIDKTPKTADKKYASLKPGPNNIADMVSKIKNNHCVHCDKTFTNKEDIINHLYDLLLPKIYACNMCKEEFITENNLKEHFQTHTSGVKIKIARLSEEEINSYLQTNLADVSRCDEYDSEDSTVNSVDRDNIDIDLANTASSPESDSIRDFKNNNAITRQINTKVVKFKCNLCFTTTCYIANIKRHIKNVHHVKPANDLFKRIIVSRSEGAKRSTNVGSRTAVVNDSELNTHNICTTEAVSSDSDHYEDANISNESIPFTDKHYDARDLDKTATKHKNKLFSNIMNESLKMIENKFDANKHSEKSPNDKRASDIGLKHTSRSPVPKSVLFKCKYCDIHYISCWAAKAHVNKCPGPKPAWECPKCFKTFKFSNKDMHERQHQFLGDEDFKVHTMDQYNRNALSIKVLHCCPKCGVHYSEYRFTKHYTECEQEIPKSYFCLICDVLIGEDHKEQHNRLHTFNKYNVEDFIIIEYESADANRDDIISINKDESDIKNIDSPKTLDVIDIENMSDDSQCKVVEKSKANSDDIEPNDIETKTDCRVARLIYCETCKTYISPFKPNNLAHFYGYCTNLLKTTCTICGLAFTCRSIFSHRNLHKRIRNFSIFNLVFYNMRFEQIDPSIPELPKCSHCLLTFECLDSKVSHECGEPKYKSCVYCGDDFNELAYKTHILFHEYVNRKTILPMSADDILKLQSIVKKKAVGSTYNFTFYQCKECSVVLDEINRDMHKKAKGDCVDLSHTYKKCFKCELTILAKEFAHHSAKHNRNSTFKIENFNIIPFQRNKQNVKTDSKKKPKKDEKNKSWCPICKIYVLESAQRHSLKHANKQKELSTKPVVKRKRDLVYDEIKVNHKKTKTELDIQTDSNDSTLEIMDKYDSPVVEVLEDHSEIVTEANVKDMPSLFKCRSCEIVLLEKPTHHECSDKEATRFCDVCKLKFYKKPYEAHEIYHSGSQLKIEKNVSYFGDKTNVVLETIYRCLCGLNFLTKSGILKHYPLCNISTRIVKQKCTKCNLIFTPPVLFNHLVTHHSKNKDFKYEIVDLTTYTSENRDEVYRCELCSAHFVVKELCEMHIENCCGENWRLVKKCPDCRLDFNVEALPLHRRKHHAAKQMKVEDFDTVIIKAKTNEQTEKTHNENEETSVNAQNAPTDDTLATTHLNTIDNLNIDSEIVITERNLKRVADKIFKNIVLENYSHVLYKCDRCDLHFTGWRSYKAHIAKNHSQNIIVVACSVCLLRFSSETCMRHEYIHHTKMNLKLEDFQFRTEYEPVKREPLKQGHISTYTLTKEAKQKILRNKNLISNKIYKCSKCDVYFLTPNTAFIHVRRFNHRLSRKMCKCNVCDISMSAQTLERHKYIHHELNNYTFKDLKVKLDVTYSYTKTGKHFDKSLIDLNRYSNKIYKCRQCNLGHLTFGALTKHVENNHQIRSRKIKCTLCNEYFAPLGLAKHKYVHHKIFKLNKDEFEFEDEISLSELIQKRKRENLATEWHIRGSKQTIIYRCKKCNVCFSSRKTWRGHNFVHIDLLEKEKKKCNECGLNFKSIALKWHINVHHREKGYTLNDFWIEERMI